MFDAIAPRYDLVNRIMTFRLDVRWRRKAVQSLAPPGRQHRARPRERHRRPVHRPRRRRVPPISIDLSFGMLAADRSGVPRVQADILRLPVPDGSVDGVTCGFALRNLVDLPTFFAELGRVVRPGGRIALLDVGIPQNPVLRFGNNIYFGKIVPKIGALLSDGAAYRYLPKSVAYLPAARADGAAPARRRVRRCRAPPAVGWPHPADGRHPPLTCAPSPARCLDADSTSTTSPPATATCSCATASASPDGVSRRG